MPVGPEKLAGELDLGLSVAADVVELEHDDQRAEAIKRPDDDSEDHPQGPKASEKSKNVSDKGEVHGFY